MNNKHITEPQILTMFNNWKNHTGKYLDLQLAEVEFNNVCVFDNLDSNNQNKYLKLDNPTLKDSKATLLDIGGNDYFVYDTAAKPFSIKKEYEPNRQITPTPSNPIISFANNGDGSAGRNFFIHKEIFYVRGERTIIIPTDMLYSIYLYYQILNMRKKYGFNRVNRPDFNNLKFISILIPQQCNGYSSYEIQVAISEFTGGFIDKILNITKFIQYESANIKTYLLNKIFYNK